MKQKKQHQLHSKPIMEELEPRQLFSGGLEGIIVENQLLDGGIHSDLNAGYSQTPASENIAQNIETVATERKELVFIDTDVENYQQLLNDILAQGEEDRNIEVILLDNERDGIEQISETLANYDNLDAVHLISHGSEGSVELGNTYLNTESLNKNLLAISDWAEAFSENGDFLIYGCNLAATDEGQSLVDALSQLTQTDVAASDDLTGSALLGGDWNLEFTTGTVETATAISALAQQTWNSLLAETVYESNETVDETLLVDNSNTWTQSFYHTSGAGSYDVNSVSIWLKETGATAQTITVSLRSGAYNGPVLASATIDTSNLNSTMTRHDLALSSTVNLFDNVAYYLSIENPSGDGNIFLGSEQTGTYLQGLLLNSGVTTSKDMVFRISQVTANSNELIPSYSQQVQGGGVVVDTAGMRLDTAFSGGTSSPSFTISGMPAGATVRDAFLYVSELDFGNVPLDNQFTLNGTSVTMSQIGSSDDTGWGSNGVVTFRADVTSIVNANVNGDNTYDLGDANDLQIQDDYEGATLVVVYEDTSAATNSLITINDGSITSRDTSSLNQSLQFNGGTPIGQSFSNATLTLVAFDGQNSFPDSVINFQSNSAGSSTTIVSANSAGSDNGGSEQYEIDITSLISQTDTSATLTQTSNSSLDYIVYPVAVSVIEFSNEAPTATDNTISTNVDTSKTLTVADFNYSDTESDPFTQVQIVSQETTGALKLNGIDVTTGQVISVSDINSNLLTFTPGAGESGASYATFSYRVHDGNQYSVTTSTLSVLTASFDSDEDGFTYADDTFGTSNPGFSTGTYHAAVGFNGGGLLIDLGGANTGGPTSGGYSKTFNLAVDTTVTVSLRYKLIMSSEYESNEYGEAILDIDGTRYGNDTNSSLIHTVGDGNGGSDDDSGWLTENFDIALSAGSHTLTIGAYNNDSTAIDEWMEVYFDDVSVTTPVYNTHGCGSDILQRNDRFYWVRHIECNICRSRTENWGGH